MGYLSVITIFTLLIALVVALLKHSMLQRHKKYALGTVLIACLIAMGAYNYKQSMQTNIATLLGEAFMQGNTLNCEGFLVHQNDFNLITQTNTLVGKSGTPTSNIIILLERCNIALHSKQDEELLNGHTIEELQRD